MRKFITSLGCLGLLATHLNAATFVVTDITDSGPGSLRQAILDANATAAADTIEFSTNGTITLGSTLPTITNNTAIIGPGTNLLTISGSNAFRVFSMRSGTTNLLSGLTIAQGYSTGTHIGGGTGTDFFTCASGISNAGFLKMSNCVVQNCTNDISYGAGIYNSGTLEMDASVIADCRAWASAVLGGGIFNTGTLHMANCVISRCRIILDYPSRGAGLCNAGFVTLTNTVIEDCNAGTIDGGGLYNRSNAVVNNCTFRRCYGYYAGGVYNDGGSLAMTNTTIIGNSAHSLGAGLYLWDGASVLSGCTISSNSCGDTGSGIMNRGDVKLYNCTVSRNRNGAGFPPYTTGVGIADKYNNKSGTTYLNHCTIAANPGGTSEISALGNFTAENSILGDCQGTLISGGHNLISNTNGCSVTGSTNGNILGVDAQLGPLQNNGGATWTLALLPGSPAIDHADAGGLLTDQRGFARPADPLASDIGAFEFVLPTLQIALTDTNTVIISWPSPSTGFVLEENSNVTTANWSDVGVTPNDNGTIKSVVTPVGVGNRFFRLRNP